VGKPEKAAINAVLPLEATKFPQLSECGEPNFIKFGEDTELHNNLTSTARY